MRTLITGGTIVRADGVFDGDLLVDGGRILELGEFRTTPVADQVVDARGCFVLPGGVDVHTHVNLTTGAGHVADGIATATRAALWGGTTTIVEHPGFGPAGCSLLHQIDEYTQEFESQSSVDYAFHGVLQHMDDSMPEQIAQLVQQGIPTCKAYTTYDGRLDDDAFLRALTALRDAGGLLTVHAENHAIIQYLVERLRQVPASCTSPMSHALSRPSWAEVEAIERLMAFAKVVDAPVYIVHLSTKGGLDAIRKAKQSGVTVLAETCPQYLLLTEDAYKDPDGLKYIMSPPLRTEADREALWEGLTDGTISVVATDHCGFSLEQKRQASGSEVFACPGGVAGLETRLPLLFSEGVLKGRLTLPRLVDIVATTPARIMGLTEKGRLEPGADADITVIDPSEERLVKAAKLHQQLDTPFEGMLVRGWPRDVWLRGEALLCAGQFCGPDAPSGQLLVRRISTNLTS